MRQADSKERAIFVVKFLRGMPPEREEWRGQVEHVQSGEKRPFHGAKQLLLLLESLFLSQNRGGDRS